MPQTNLTEAEADLLRLIRRNVRLVCPMTYSEIAEQLGITAPTVQYRLHKLASMGLVTIDGRSRRIEVIEPTKPKRRKKG